ncbi:MAG: TIGR00341 family protein [Minisyncoccia bacterium]
MYLLFKDIKEADKHIAINSLINESTPKPSFFFMVILSVVMATCGLLINNASVIIGSMLIAPILSPILATALGISIADNIIIHRSLKTLAKSAFFSIAISALTTLALWQFTVSGEGSFATVFNPEIISRTQPTVVYLFIAIVAGLTTAFARMKPELNETLPGTAIAIALVPPLATIGIGIATWNLSIVSGALSMFVLNSVGIILAALVIFSLMNIHEKKKTVERAQEKADQEQEKIKEEFNEEKKIKKEKEKIKEEVTVSIEKEIVAK